MKRMSILAAGSLALLAGCAGQSSSSNYAGFDPSMNSPMGTSKPNASGPGAVPNVASWPVEDGVPMVVHGVSLPSIHFFDAQKKDAYNSDTVEKALKDIRDIGFNVVKLYAFEGKVGLKIEKDGTVTGIEDAAIKNLQDAIERARAHKLKVYLTVNQSFKGFEKSPLADKKVQDAYLKNVVAPLARKFKAHEAVFAFDLHGGLEKELAGEKPAANWDSARQYVKAASDAVKRQDPERLLSAGPVSIDAIGQGKLTGIGLDFYSVIRYDDQGALPAARELKADRPVIVGIAAQSTQEAKDEIQATALRTMIQNSAAGGYSGVVVWAYSGDAVHSLVDASGKHRPAVEAVKASLAAAKPIAEPKK